MMQADDNDTLDLEEFLILVVELMDDWRQGGVVGALAGDGWWCASWYNNDEVSLCNMNNTYMVS